MVTQLEPVTCTELTGWTANDNVAGFAAYLKAVRHCLKDGVAAIDALPGTSARKRSASAARSGDRSHLLEQNLNSCVSRGWARPTGDFEPVFKGRAFPLAYSISRSTVARVT